MVHQLALWGLSHLRQEPEGEKKDINYIYFWNEYVGGVHTAYATEQAARPARLIFIFSLLIISSFFKVRGREKKKKGRDTIEAGF